MTVVPSVACPPVLATANVNVPLPPRINVEELDVFVIVRLTGSTVLTVTDPVPLVVSPPPMTLAVLVKDAEAFDATVTGTLMLLKLDPPLTTLVLVHVTV